MLVHQTNCRTTSAAGLAKDIFSLYPNANCYNLKTVRKPGYIDVRLGASDNKEPYICNLHGQDAPGGPTLQETREDRLRWFETGL